jgi:hypothetical protein
MRITSANGESGCLIYSNTQDKYFFRVYDSHHNFIDYDILHSDLGLKIEDPDAYFYEHEDGRMLLDHAPETLGLIKE